MGEVKDDVNKFFCVFKRSKMVKILLNLDNCNGKFCEM